MKRLMIGVLSVALAATGAVALNVGSTSAAAAQSTQASVANLRGPGPGHADGTHAGGQVASVSGTTITVTGRDGASQSIATTDSTSFTLDGSASSLAAIAAGQFVRAEGSTDSAGVFTAAAIDARTTPPQGRPGGRHP